MNPTKKDQNKICQTQIDGKPNAHVVGSSGEPNSPFPITAPGPNPKNIKKIPSAKAAGIRYRLLIGIPA